MVARNVAHIPDELWAKFQSGEIDHFVYHVGENAATAVFADCSTLRFDTTVRPEHIAEDRQRWLERLSSDPSVRVLYDGVIEVSKPSHHHQIKNFR